MYINCRWAHPSQLTCLSLKPQSHFQTGAPGGLALLLLPKGAPKVTKGDAQGRVLPVAMPSIPLLSLRGSVSQPEERRRMVGLVSGTGGRGAHHEQEEARQKLDETLLPSGPRP